MKLKYSWCILGIIVVLLSIVIYRAQDIKEIAIGIYRITFGPRESAQTPLPKDLPEQTKRNTPSEINQHTEGDQAPIVNVGPEGKSTINYGPPKDRGKSE